MNHALTYQDYNRSAEYIRERMPFNPQVGLILGSGLGPLAQRIEQPVSINYQDIPGFLVTTNKAHAGKMIFGTLGGKKVVCLSGRFHSYEGYSFEELTIPVRVLKLLGISTLIVTNAAGAVNLDYHPGDIMIIKDQIVFSGYSPMRGKNTDEFGPRFFDVSHMYDPALRQLALSLADKTSLHMHEGVYFFMQGPQFETPAEIRAIRTLGGDAVGMSTVTESLTAAHCGIPVLGFSVITNMAAGILDKPITDEEVREIGDMVSHDFSTYMESVIRAI